MAIRERWRRLARRSADEPRSAPHPYTPIGTLGSPFRAPVDPTGLVTLRPGSWALDWWIGGDDRWHLPSQEAAVRQRLIDLTPVVETSMRVPGGDAVHRAYAVRDTEDLVVVEIENRSPAPFAVALAVRPDTPEGTAKVETIELAERTVMVDGRPGVVLPARPLRMAGTTLADGDVADIVTGGRAGTELPQPLRCRRGRASAAFLFPLAHTATMRIALPFDAGGEWADQPLGLLPSAASAAAGWVALTRPGMRIEIPAGMLADAYEANCRFVLLDDAHHPDGPAPPGALADRLDHLVRTASPTFTWPDGGASGAEFVRLVRSLLLRDDENGVALCTELPPDWRGFPLEVHDAPTAHGSMSYAVRWHGARPALLWELVPPAGGAGAVVVTAPGLDPSFRSTEVRGEALLG